MTAGQDHVVTPGAGDTIERRRLDADAAGMDVAQEVALLELVAAVSPLPVPRVLSVSADGAAMVMQRMPGRPLLDSIEAVDEAEAARLGEQLGGLLAALHAVPLDRLRPLVPAERSALAEHHADAVRIVEELGGQLPEHLAGSVRALLTAGALAAPQELVLCHNDLGAEHVFVVASEAGVHEITGVIDWSDASVSDPCLDLGLIWRDLGEAGCAAALARSGIDATTEIVERARFYACARALEDLEFGFETGQEPYVDNARRALGRLLSGQRSSPRTARPG